MDKRNFKGHQVVLSLGGNVGNTKEIFKNAILFLEKKVGKLISKSALYKTKAWGVEDQPDFLNQVVIIVTESEPADLLKICMELEKEYGRNRTQTNKWEERTLDIDILFYEDRIINTDALIIPHPYIHKRNFILIPLVEIIPDYIQPSLKKSIKQLKKTSKDKLQVIKLLD